MLGIRDGAIKKMDMVMAKKRTKPKKTQKSKILNFNFKNLGNDISDYPFVEIRWMDIEGDTR